MSEDRCNHLFHIEIVDRLVQIEHAVAMQTKIGRRRVGDSRPFHIEKAIRFVPPQGLEVWREHAVILVQRRNDRAPIKRRPVDRHGIAPGLDRRVHNLLAGLAL